MPDMVDLINLYRGNGTFNFDALEKVIQIMPMSQKGKIASAIEEMLDEANPSEKKELLKIREAADWDTPKVQFVGKFDIYDQATVTEQNNLLREGFRSRFDYDVVKLQTAGLSPEARKAGRGVDAVNKEIFDLKRNKIPDSIGQEISMDPDERREQVNRIIHNKKAELEGKKRHLRTRVAQAYRDQGLIDDDAFNKLTASGFISGDSRKDIAARKAARSGTSRGNIKADRVYEEADRILGRYYKAGEGDIVGKHTMATLIKNYVAGPEASVGSLADIPDIDEISHDLAAVSKVLSEEGWNQPYEDLDELLRREFTQKTSGSKSKTELGRLRYELKEIRKQLSGSKKGQATKLLNKLNSEYKKNPERLVHRIAELHQEAEDIYASGTIEERIAGRSRSQASTVQAALEESIGVSIDTGAPSDKVSRKVKTNKGLVDMEVSRVLTDEVVDEISLSPEDAAQKQSGRTFGFGKMEITPTRAQEINMPINEAALAEFLELTEIGYKERTPLQAARIEVLRRIVNDSGDIPGFENYAVRVKSSTGMHVGMLKTRAAESLARSLRANIEGIETYEDSPIYKSFHIDVRQQSKASRAFQGVISSADGTIAYNPVKGITYRGLTDILAVAVDTAVANSEISLGSTERGLLRGVDYMKKDMIENVINDMMQNGRLKEKFTSVGGSIIVTDKREEGKALTYTFGFDAPKDGADTKFEQLVKQLLQSEDDMRESIRGRIEFGTGQLEQNAVEIQKEFKKQLLYELMDEFDLSEDQAEAVIVKMKNSVGRIDSSRRIATEIVEDGVTRGSTKKIAERGLEEALSTTGVKAVKSIFKGDATLSGIILKKVLESNEYKPFSPKGKPQILAADVVIGMSRGINAAINADDTITQSGGEAIEGLLHVEAKKSLKAHISRIYPEANTKVLLDSVDDYIDQSFGYEARKGAQTLSELSAELEGSMPQVKKVIDFVVGNIEKSEKSGNTLWKLKNLAIKFASETGGFESAPKVSANNDKVFGAVSEIANDVMRLMVASSLGVASDDLDVVNGGLDALMDKPGVGLTRVFRGGILKNEKAVELFSEMMFDTLGIKPKLGEARAVNLGLLRAQLRNMRGRWDAGFVERAKSGFKEISDSMNMEVIAANTLDDYDIELSRTGAARYAQEILDENLELIKQDRFEVGTVDIDKLIQEKIFDNDRIKKFNEADRIDEAELDAVVKIMRRQLVKIYDSDKKIAGMPMQDAMRLLEDELRAGVITGQAPPNVRFSLAFEGDEGEAGTLEDIVHQDLYGGDEDTARAGVKAAMLDEDAIEGARRQLSGGEEAVDRLNRVKNKLSASMGKQKVYNASPDTEMRIAAMQDVVIDIIEKARLSGVSADDPALLDPDITAEEYLQTAVRLIKEKGKGIERDFDTDTASRSRLNRLLETMADEGEDALINKDSFLRVIRAIEEEDNIVDIFHGHTDEANRLVLELIPHTETNDDAISVLNKLVRIDSYVDDAGEEIKFSKNSRITGAKLTTAVAQTVDDEIAGLGEMLEAYEEIDGIKDPKHPEHADYVQTRNSYEKLVRDRKQVQQHGIMFTVTDEDMDAPRVVELSYGETSEGKVRFGTSGMGGEMSIRDIRPSDIKSRYGFSVATGGISGKEVERSLGRMNQAITDLGATEAEVYALTKGLYPNVDASPKEVMLALAGAKSKTRRIEGVAAAIGDIEVAKAPLAGDTMNAEQMFLQMVRLMVSDNPDVDDPGDLLNTLGAALSDKTAYSLEGAVDPVITEEEIQKTVNFYRRRKASAVKGGSGVVSMTDDLTDSQGAMTAMRNASKHDFSAIIEDGKKYMKGKIGIMIAGSIAVTGALAVRGMYKRRHNEQQQLSGAEGVAPTRISSREDGYDSTVSIDRSGGSALTPHASGYSNEIPGSIMNISDNFNNLSSNDLDSLLAE